MGSQYSATEIVSQARPEQHIIKAPTKPRGELRAHGESFGARNGLELTHLVIFLVVFRVNFRLVFVVPTGQGPWHLSSDASLA